ncbi:DUF4012 domain-containing protein [Cellulomonas sp.]|uniref:DUF4012 domain-containing protein n=1 Tax=Cellulomonas sp. TaxID=40001 RepID=UPI002812005D|nr:DUF4012 domain-containing protein [Cellulomonas sp.]
MKHPGPSETGAGTVAPVLTEPGASGPAARSTAAAAPRRRRRTVLRVVLAVLVLLLLAAGWVTLRAAQAGLALRDAAAGLEVVDIDLEDPGTAADDLAALRTHTSRARAAAADPVWRAAEVVPVAGEQLTAVRVVATVADDVARDALPAVRDVSALLDGGLRRADGRVDVDAVERAARTLATAAATTSTAHDRLAALDPDRLVGRLADAVRDAQGVASRADASLGPAARGAALLPELLGADGPRTYLVLALNSAELRAPGGIVGAITAVRAEDGALTVVGQRSTVELGVLDSPVLPLTAEELATHTDRLGRRLQNASLTPHFPRTAELVAARWQRDVGGPVDGVVATDPLAIARVVDVVGPVPGPDGGALTGGALVHTLLRDVPLTHPDEESDALFAAVAASVVSAVGQGEGATPELVRALVRAVDERRLRVWSAHADEQEVLAGSVVGAAFLGPGAAGDPGLFLDDASQSKLGLDLRTAVDFRDARCDGPAPRVTAVLTLDYRPPADVATFPVSVLGARGLSGPPGTLATVVSAWARVGDPAATVRRDGAVVGGTSTTVAGRQVQQVTSVLLPGGRQEVAVDLPLRDGAVTLWTTPTVTSPGVASFRCP